MRRRVLITDDIHPLFIEKMQSLEFACDFLPSISQQEVESIIPDYEGLIINSKIAVQPPLIDKAKRLLFIGRLGSGMEHVDIEYCQKKNIACFKSPEGNSNAVAEHVIGMLLCLLNKTFIANNQLKDGVWQREENRGIELFEKTVGIIGYGHTGSSLAKRLRGFDNKILVFDKYKNIDIEKGVQQVDISEILDKAEIISFHIPYNEETHHWINYEFLNKTKKKPIIINTSRGKIADTKELVQALKEEVISGLCIDVFEEEPIFKKPDMFKELLSLPNVVATPHVAGWTVESKEKLASILFEKISQHLQL